MEGRGRRDTELLEGKTTEPLTPDTVSTRLQRIAELAREDPKRAFRSLAHHIDLEFLQEAFRRTRKDGATGVDGQTSSEYEERLEENLRSLLDRFKSGQYKAPPVRRTYVPKGDGRQKRPIGIPTFEDKVLQRAVAMVLEAVYEQDFLPCSYGYRPGRSAHQALADLRDGLMAMGGGWILEVDIKSFFDTISHPRLREILDQRVRDGVLRRTIDKWLAAGERDVKPRLTNRAFMVRFADDLVMVFVNERDARRVWDVRPKRLGRYGLTLHPIKTRLVEFRPRSGGTKPPISGAGRSFDLLGFTHFWAKSRRGFWVVKLKTAGDRFGRAVKRMHEWCRKYRHAPVPWQHEQLMRKLRGHDNYYGVRGNYVALTRFRYELRRVWRKWLQRRSHRSRMSWERFNRLLKRYPLLKPTICCQLQSRAANP